MINFKKILLNGEIIMSVANVVMYEFETKADLGKWADWYKNEYLLNGLSNKTFKKGKCCKFKVKKM